MGRTAEKSFDVRNEPKSTLLAEATRAVMSAMPPIATEVVSRSETWRHAGCSHDALVVNLPNSGTGTSKPSLAVLSLMDTSIWFGVIR